MIHTVITYNVIYISVNKEAAVMMIANMKVKKANS